MSATAGAKGVGVPPRMSMSLPPKASGSSGGAKSSGPPRMSVPAGATDSAAAKVAAADPDLAALISGYKSVTVNDTSTASRSSGGAKSTGPPRMSVTAGANVTSAAKADLDLAAGQKVYNGDAVASVESKTVECSAPNYVAKLAFLIDMTGSMTPVMDAVKEKIRQVIDKCVEGFPMIGLEIALVGYRDKTGGGDRYFSLPFQKVNNPYVEDEYARLVAALNSITCQGGDDFPEDVLGGMQRALESLDWSTGLQSGAKTIKLLFHIGDAPHHGALFCEPEYGDKHPDLENSPRPYDAILGDFATRKIDYYFGKIRSPPEDPNGTVHTDKMVSLFRTAYDNYAPRNQFQELDFTSFSVERLFQGIVGALSTSIRSVLRKAGAP